MTDEQWLEVKEIGRLMRQVNHVITVPGARLEAMDVKLDALSRKVDALEGDLHEEPEG